MSQPNWLGLLKWSLAHSDGTAPSQFSEMTAEDKGWLERVMKEGVKDEPQRINEIMLYMKEVLSRPADQDILEAEQDDIEMQLEELRDIVEQVDMAQVITKFGGCEVLLELLNFAPLNNNNKAVAAAAIGTITQNNITTQDVLYQKNFLASLVPIFLTVTSTLVKNKILYAISCMIRGHAAAEEAFVLQYANTLTTHLLLKDSTQPVQNTLIARYFFLINALLTSDYASLSRLALLVDLFIPSLLPYATSTYPEVAENSMNVLVAMSQSQVGWIKLTSVEVLPQVQACVQHREAFIRQQPTTSHEEEEEGVVDGGEGMTKEEKQHAMKLVITLRVGLEKLKVNYPLMVSSTVSEEESTTAPVMLIGPPSLTASSPVP